MEQERMTMQTADTTLHAELRPMAAFSLALRDDLADVIEPEYNPWLDDAEPDPNPEPEPDPPWARIDPALAYDGLENAYWRIQRKPKSLSEL
jgi:hypothetical protein